MWPSYPYVRRLNRRQFLGASALLAAGSFDPLRSLRAGTEAAPALERRLYVTNASGISVYDIDNGHAFLRKIDIPDSGEYKGIAASPALGRLYVTSHRPDELICL